LLFLAILLMRCTAHLINKIDPPFVICILSAWIPSLPVPKLVPDHSWRILASNEWLLCTKPLSVRLHHWDVIAWQLVWWTIDIPWSWCQCNLWKEGRQLLLRPRNVKDAARVLY
jgi:hypothetical protein